MRQISIALMGFGNVGQAFASLLLKKQEVLKNDFNVEIIVTGIYTKNHGAAINSGGINLKRALEFITRGISLTNISEEDHTLTAEDFINDSSAEIFIESTPLNPFDGQPALT